jgi:hypothetical protein
MRVLDLLLPVLGVSWAIVATEALNPVTKSSRASGSNGRCALSTRSTPPWAATARGARSDHPRSPRQPRVLQIGAQEQWTFQLALARHSGRALASPQLALTFQAPPKRSRGCIVGKVMPLSQLK